MGSESDRVHEFEARWYECEGVGLKFTKLSKYALSLMANSRVRKNKFTLCVSNLVKMEFKAAMLIIEIDISRLMTYVKQV